MGCGESKVKSPEASLSADCQRSQCFLALRNPLAAALLAEYSDKKQRVLKLQREEVIAVAEKMTKKDTETALNDHNRNASEPLAPGAASSPPLPQRSFTLEVDLTANNAKDGTKTTTSASSTTSAAALPALLLVHTISTFQGHVAYDSTGGHMSDDSDSTADQQQWGTAGGASNESAAGCWAGPLQVTFTGANPSSEAKLRAAQGVYEQMSGAAIMETLQTGKAPLNPALVKKIAAAAGGGGSAQSSGTLFLCAVVSYPVQGSYMHRTPWELEVCVVF